ncbi:MAG: hypothetical protein DRI46_07850 [Chloroflexi bacterium]|nr:MAG: hypothetical protein DRI46_07850 [Chloroflexota bacterium]
MKIVTIVDEDGLKQRYQIQDDDDPNDAAEVGLNIGVPNLEQVDWEEVRKELHNRLFDMRLFTMQDIIDQQSGMGNAISSVLLKKIKGLYK